MSKPRPRAHACDRVLSMALEAPWAITTSMLGVVAHVLGHRLAGDALDMSEVERREPTEAVSAGDVAVIPIHGVLAPRMNLFSEISGGATYEGAGLDLAMAMADPKIKTIVLDVDSPGGSVQGCSEFARKVLKARATKPVIAVAHYQMCSAAYWIGACATELVAAPSAHVGSLGVYSIHEDLSKALAEMGVKLTYVAAGKYKVDGNETEPLTETARARIQANVDSAYDMFVTDVAFGRGRSVEDVRNGFGQGAGVTAAEAVTLGMIDRIDTFEDTVARVLPSGTALSALAMRPTPQEPLEATGDRQREQLALEREWALLGYAVI
jgi:signal peptide peptidase SppA